MQYSACIEMLFGEVPFIERVGRAKDAGFSHVEFWLWKPKDMGALKEELDKTGMEVGVFQGNTAGRMVDPQDHDRYCDGVLESLETAKDLGARNLFCMTDILRDEDRTVDPPARPVSQEEKQAAILAVMDTLTKEAASAGVTLLMEPLNVLVDHAGYYIERSSIAWDLHSRIAHPNVKVLYDVYHMQIMEGNIIATLCENIDAIGYVHVADVPGRHEPGTGEINYANVARALRDVSYAGLVGFEYMPMIDTERSLAISKQAFGF